MKRTIFERLTPKNRKNVPKITKLSPAGGLRLQERKLLHIFVVRKTRM
jgi:hypothetical protein